MLKLRLITRVVSVTTVHRSATWEFAVNRVRRRFIKFTRVVPEFEVVRGQKGFSGCVGAMRS